MAFLPVLSPLLSRPAPTRRLHLTQRQKWRQCASPTNPSRASLDSLLDHLRSRNPSTSSNSPRVHLVGTGPGDPELLTLKAVRLMREADVVLYDRLVSQDILRFVNPEATMIYVGKEAGYHTRSQDDIHLLLQHFAREGRTVIRLKGGDPYIFGRGGEEKDFLEKWDVDVEAVPGITAAAGIAAGLGIPLTMRGIANSVRFLTGHSKEGGIVEIGQVDKETTLVVYMGLGTLGDLVREFEKGGVGPRVACAAVERGTTLEQRVVVGEMRDFEQKVRNMELKSPTLIIVGDVVRLSRTWKDEMGEDLQIGSLRTDASNGVKVA